jgi:hypothetical protein
MLLRPRPAPRRLPRRSGELEDLRLAKKRMAALRKGRSGTITLDALMKRYGVK